MSAPARRHGSGEILNGCCKEPAEPEPEVVLQYLSACVEGEDSLSHHDQVATKLLCLAAFGRVSDEDFGSQGRDEAVPFLGELGRRPSVLLLERREQQQAAGLERSVLRATGRADSRHPAPAGE